MHRFTVGAEEEFQIVDPQTWELRSHVSQLLESSAPVLGDQIKRELHQSIVEVGTKICSDSPSSGPRSSASGASSSRRQSG